MNQPVEQLNAQTQAPVQIPSMNDIKKQYFAASQLESASEAINTAIQICDANNGTKVYNFDPAEDFPEGYGLAIAPRNERNKETNTNVTVGVTIAAIPEFALLNETPEGQTFIHDVITDKLISKMQNAVRVRSDGSQAASIPLTVADFITSNRPDGVLKAFRTLQTAYVKLLRDKGLKLMTVDILRQTLQSSAFAEQQFPRVQQSIWQDILTSMIHRAESDNLAPGALLEWKETRDTAGLPSVDDVDLAGLDFDDL